ncbi:hypothetical protein Q7F20_00010 [Curtobacterium sp. A7_M15]|nr:hypothetical protein [Curtobacterium sp. A7_M15]
MFVDESQLRDYLLVAVSVDAGHLPTARSAVAGVILRGQTRLHMRKESDARRRLILSTTADLDVDVTVFRAPKDGRSDVERRAACVRALVVAADHPRGTSVCLERDETLVQKDRQWIVEARHRHQGNRQFTHRHESARQEPLLALPDALGWAWAKGGDWRRRCNRSFAVISV